MMHSLTRRNLIYTSFQKCVSGSLKSDYILAWPSLTCQICLDFAGMKLHRPDQPFCMGVGAKEVRTLSTREEGRMETRGKTNV